MGEARRRKELVRWYHGGLAGFAVGDRLDPPGGVLVTDDWLVAKYGASQHGWGDVYVVEPGGTVDKERSTCVAAVVLDVLLRNVGAMPEGEMATLWRRYGAPAAGKLSYRNLVLRAPRTEQAARRAVGRSEP